MALVCIHPLNCFPGLVNLAVPLFAFVIYGSNANVDENGNVVSIIDAQTSHEGYKFLCEANGQNCDATIVLG